MCATVFCPPTPSTPHCQTHSQTVFFLTVGMVSFRVVSSHQFAYFCIVMMIVHQFVNSCVVFRSFKVLCPPPHLRPVKIMSGKDLSSSVFIYTPLSLGNSDRKGNSSNVGQSLDSLTDLHTTVTGRPACPNSSSSWSLELFSCHPLLLGNETAVPLVVHACLCTWGCS